jgi:hypothetical protein
MGLHKEHMSYVEQHLKGEEAVPAVNGGFITIIKDGEDTFIANVPTFNMMAENHSDSTVENDEEFEDEEGQYIIYIWSSMYGVSWELTVKAKNTSEQLSLEKRLDTKYDEVY